jgi:hypothetical protein
MEIDKGNMEEGAVEHISFAIFLYHYKMKSFGNGD